MVLSAADLQKQLEGAPDPFPVLGESSPNPTASTSNSAPLNTDSETLFPSLATPSTSKAPTSSWTVRAVKPVSTPVYTDSFALTGIDPSASHTKDGKPRSLGDIVKDIQTKHKVKVEVFSQRTSNQTTFTITGASDASVDAAKRALTTSLSPVITLAVQTPVSVVGSIVGQKGANLKRIRDLTSTKIDIPRRDNLAVPNANSQDDSRSPSPYPTSPADENEATIRITITGPASMAHEAQAMIQAIITEKTSRSVQKIKITPPYVFPFVLSRRADFLKVANGAEINLNRDEKTKEITVNGDREAVGKVIESIRSCMAFYEGDLTSVKITLPKRQHHLLTGQAHEDIFQKSKCNAVIPGPEDPSEDVQVWGKATNLGAGLQAVMELANSQHTRSLPIPGGHPRHVLTHLHRSGYGKSFGNSHPNVSVHFPPVSVVGQATIDFSGERAPVDSAYKELAAHLALLDGATRNIPVDYLLHNILNAKAGKQLKNYHGSKNTLVYFPPESDSDSNVLLVYDPLAAQPVKNKQAVLAEIEAEILGHVAGLGQIKTETVSVERKWHPAVTGKNGSTLNALIGEGRALSIEVGGNGQEDIVVIRGTPAEVDRATKDILMIVEEAKNDATASAYSTEFHIPQQFVARIVGAAGAGIQKYREQLDVKIDIDDARDSGEQVVGKKKKAPSTQSLIRITGRKQNAEEAKKRILAQVDKMADETMEILKIPRQYHSSIIGQQGKYIQRLQDKYGVKINIGKDASTDEVQIRGGKKGVSQAKNEIQELVEYEKENNHTITVEVSSRSIPRILGAKGAKIHEIMADTTAHIDVNDGNKDKSKGADEAGPASITIRGTKKAVAAAKAAVLAIANAVDDETTVVLHIEPKFHRTIIGGGGVGLKNLLARVGAPSDPKEQAGLVRFPQNGDEVTLRGESKLVKKIQAEIERVVAGLRERVVLGVVIPAQQHRMLIGHGGQPLMELEKRTGAEVQFPGSRSYNQVAPAENAAELEEADPKNIVKVVGPRAACEKAIAELLESVAKAPNRERREQNRERTSSGPVATVQVPFKHYHLLRPTGNLIRDLRASGAQFSQAGKPKHEGDGAASRIDDDVEVDSHGVEWKALPYGAGAEDGATDVTLKARDEESLEKAQSVLADALAKAEEITHIGYMTFPDRSAFPRIIGNKGAVINDLSVESGTEIIVPKDDTTIKIYGTEDGINKAKAAITRVAFGRGRRNDD